MTFPVREARPSDMGLVRDAWRRSFEPASRLFRINRGAYTQLFDSLLSEWLNEDSVTVRVTADPEDEDHVLAFAVAREPELHYVYVKHDFRRRGLVPEMLRGLTLKQATFKTRMGDERLRPAERGWAFTPRFTL